MRRSSARAALLVAVAVAVVLLAAVAGGYVLSRPEAPPASDVGTAAKGPAAGTAAGATAGGSAAASPLGTAVTWFARNAKVGARVLVPADDVATVSKALPDRTVLADEASRQPGDLLLVSGTAAPRSLGTTPVARFGRDASTLWVAQVQDDLASPAGERAAVREAGRELAANPGLRLSGSARQALLAGTLDSRALVVLNGLASTHRLDVDLAPDEASASAGAAQRTVLVTAVDGRPVDRADDPDAAAVLRFLRSQADVLRPTEPVRADSTGLRVTYGLPAPSALLTGSTFPTTSPGAPS